MGTYRRSGSALAAIAFLGMVCVFGSGGRLFAKEASASSSECITCHTDLDRMDSYGAASAGGAAAIAG